ncbi:hypothetical protein QTO34_004093 [Cnephaeus nilssonii]|uniref:Uncharacterized protein n=1 Tax=Cnephaeus nilssonii TaxID=3371016 RepID=A0AA40HRV9_CNENI|nr:hypothetical protein QTO34_004093 [Eptesicus nilssonii]
MHYFILCEINADSSWSPMSWSLVPFELLPQYWSFEQVKPRRKQLGHKCSVLQSSTAFNHSVAGSCISHPLPPWLCVPAQGLGSVAAALLKGPRLGCEWRQGARVTLELRLEAWMWANCSATSPTGAQNVPGMRKRKS